VHPRSWWRRTLKQAILRKHFARCDAFITIGDNNESYYRHYGVPTSKMYRGAYPIDLNRFRMAVEQSDPASRNKIRQRFGLPHDAIVALQAGKLQPSKRPEHFVAAMEQLARRNVPVFGLFVGDGPLRRDLEKQIGAAGLGDRVRITGFVNQSDIPAVLHSGDMLVSTSESDPHPLVVTESLAMGLPIVASDRVGCIGPTDTARPGVNTLVYKYGEIGQLADHIQTLVMDSRLRVQMGRESLRIAPTQDVSATVDAVLRATRTLPLRRADGRVGTDEFATVR
jgi:glycosyltransferase involved in cell wall biosynthesis